jgi:hypothetical protein
MTAKITPNPDTSSKSRWRPILIAIISVIVMFVVLAMLVIVIRGIPNVLEPLPQGEIQMGMVVVLAISALLALLSISVIVYSALSLSDPKQALGLPEGSIRALIALFLLMMFIIMSVYLFRVMSAGVLVVIPNLSPDQIVALGGTISKIEKGVSGNYDVTLGIAVTAGTEQVALQLITVLGTLVTAVSAFYFGSSTATSAAERATTKAALAAAPADQAVAEKAASAAAQKAAAEAVPASGETRVSAQTPPTGS